MKKTRLSPLQKAKRDVRIAEAKLRIAKRVLRERELEEGARSCKKHLAITESGIVGCFFLVF